MTITIENETEYKADFNLEDEIKRTVIACRDYLSLDDEIEVSVLLTDNESIHELNRENRGIDRPTDVLSFPLLTFEKAGDPDTIKDEECDIFNPDTGDMMLGDIVISVDKVREQAKEYGHSEKRELLFLVAHSMLHLYGFDHMEDDEREEMERMQREILDSIGVSR